jgi:hypothetical protein
MLYPPVQEFCIRALDLVLVLVIVAGHIKVLWDGRPRSWASKVADGKPADVISLDGKFVPYHDYAKDGRHNS